MLDLRINNEPLDLAPGTQLEVEENNPYLQLGEEIKGEYTWPVTIPNTPHNLRLMNYAGIPQRRVNKMGLSATCFDAGLQHSGGKIMLEKTGHHLNDAQRGEMSIYYVLGLSSLWQDIKGKKLREIDLGGVQSFPMSPSFSLSGNGFWAHINQVLRAAPRTYSYCFYTAIVDDFSWSNDQNQYQTDFVNATQFRNGIQQFRQYYVKLVNGSLTEGDDANPICPQVYLQPVLIKAVELAGWKLEGAILNDPDFNTITFNTLKSIDWCFFVGGARVLNMIPKPQVSFNLVDHLPDIDVTLLLLALRNRFGWWYEVDKGSKVLRIRQLKDVAYTTVKDMTAKASPLMTKTVLDEKVIYSLRNSSNGAGTTNLSGMNYQGELNDPGSLPPPNQNRADHVYLVQCENNYVVCTTNTQGQWKWEMFAPNTGDVEPSGATEEIISDSTVCAIERIAGPFGEYFPRINGTGFWPGRNEDNQSHDIQLCFHFGLQPDPEGRLWSFASHHIYNSRMLKVGNWPLSFLAKDKSGNEIGLYERCWRAFLERLQSSEELETTLDLTRSEFMAMRFSDVLVVAGVKMYVKKRSYVLPFKGQVMCECRRL